MRIVGVDRVPSTPFPRGENARKPVLTSIQNRTRKAKRALAARGHDRSRHLVVRLQARGRIVRRRHTALALANPIAAELSDMRPSLHARLDRGGADAMPTAAIADVALFEVGQMFKGDQPRGSVHRRDRRAPRAARKPPASAATGRAGRAGRCLRRQGRRLRRAGCRRRPMQALQVVPGGPAWFHPGRCGTIQIGPQNVLGHFGELHPRALDALKAEGPLVAFEVILEKIPEPKAKADARQADARTVAVPAGRARFCLCGRAQRESRRHRARGAERRQKLIASVTVFDVYEGKGIEPGKKSIAIAVTMQPRDKTMTDAEIDALGAQDRRRGRQAHRRGVAGVIVTLRWPPKSRASDDIRRLKIRPLSRGSPSRSRLSRHKSAKAKPSRSTVSPTSPQSCAPASARPTRRSGIRRSRRTGRCRPADRVEQRRVEAAAGKRRRQFLQVDDGEMRLDAGRDHVARKPRGRLQPQRKHRRDAGAGELLLAIGADVLEEQIAEDHMRDAARLGVVQSPSPFRARRLRSDTETECAR